MSERSIIIQWVVNQRDKRPTGIRLWSDRLIQRCSEENPVPDAVARLDVPRDLLWQEARHVDDQQMDAIRAAIEHAKFSELPPKVLINYCKEDPGAAIWSVNLDGQSVQVIVYDPRPKRNPALDNLEKVLALALAT